MRGAADSRLARGLVALLIRGLRGESPNALRQLDVRRLAEASGFASLLTTGRLNGLENMVRLMTEQIERAETVRDESAAGNEADEAGTSPLRAPPPTTPIVPSQPELLWPAAEEEVALLLSGGVDSSVALHRLLASGYRVRCFYLRIWLEDEQAHAARGDCPWEEDWAYCRAVCEQAGVPLEAVSLQHEYQEHVVGYLIAEAAAGRTPNPDIMCNSRIKFGVFHDRVGTHFARVASGHYAQTDHDWHHQHGGGGGGGPVQLLRSADAHKDQTYFLSQLRQSQLASACFPIGGMPKPHVRAHAERLGLPNRARKDSQGICFLGQVNYDGFLRDHLGERPGEIREFETGEMIGTHRGLWFHTVGQRRGLGPVLNNMNRARGPWHVVRKDLDANVLYATRHYSDADKERNEFATANINWVAGGPPPSEGPLEIQVKVRHSAHAHDAHVTLLDGGSARTCTSRKRDEKGLAPGQFAAFYDGEVCLGSGPIVEGAV